MRNNNNNLQQQFSDYLTWCEINSLEAKDTKSLIAYVQQQQQNFINKLKEAEKQEEWLKLREEEN